MAKTSLNSTNKLQIFINPAGQGKTAIADFSQYGGYSLVFDEVAQKIYLAGNTYTFKTLTNAEYTSITNAVTTLTNALNDQNNGSLANKIAALETALGKIDTNLDVNVGTGNTKNVKNALEALQDQIDTLSTTVSTNASNAVQISANETTLTNTDAIKSAIATAKSEALTAAASDAASKDNTLKSNIEGTATSGKTIPVTTGTGEQAVTTNEAFTDHKTLGYLWDRLADAYARIETLGGTDLANVQNAITAIKAELMDTDGDTGDLANSLIDKLSGFLNSQTSWTIGETSVANIGAIITALQGQITANSTADQGYTDTKITGLLGTANTAGNTVYGAKKDAADAAAEAAKHTSVTENSSYLDIATSTNAVGGTQYQISTTSAFDTVASNASAAKSATDILRGDSNTTGSLAKAVADLKGTKAAGDTTDETIAGAKAYANNVASTAAGQVITWEVIGSGS